MVEKKTMINRLKLLIWSIAAGTIVAFFFSSNILNFATGFSPGSGILFISPIFCGFILGLLTTREELYHSVIAAIIMTITAVLLITITLFSPVIFGVSGDFVGLYYVFVIQNIMMSVVLIFPISLTCTVIGKVFGEATLLSTLYKRERAMLRNETLEWYRMLEATVERKELKPIGWAEEEITAESRSDNEIDTQSINETEGTENPLNEE